jgi:hypothetical protein
METDTEGAGHVVVEYWDKDYDKWVMCDPQEGVIPFSKEVLLSAYELGQEILKDASVSYEKVVNARFVDEDAKHYQSWIKDYLYYFDIAIEPNYSITNEGRLVERKLMLVPKGEVGQKIFQGKFPINAEYTISVDDFYK